MKKPEPQSGDIICFDFLFKRDKEKGLIDGEKDRPCAIVLARVMKEGHEPTVLLAPITHTEPKPGVDAIELTGRMRKACGLDDQKQWIITSEINTASWTDAGIVPAEPGKQWLVGRMPKGLAEAARNRAFGRIKKRQASVIERSKAPLKKKRLNRQKRQGRGLPKTPPWPQGNRLNVHCRMLPLRMVSAI